MGIIRCLMAGRTRLVVHARQRAALWFIDTNIALRFLFSFIEESRPKCWRVCASSVSMRDAGIVFHVHDPLKGDAYSSPYFPQYNGDWSRREVLHGGKAVSNRWAVFGTWYLVCTL